MSSSSSVINQPKFQLRTENNKKCAPLSTTCTTKIYLKNTFRITGLPVTTGAREIKRRMDDFKDGIFEHTHAFQIDPPPNIEQIKEAELRLKDPQLKFIDDFFWFWPLNFDQTVKDPSLDAINKGDKDIPLKKWIEKESDPYSDEYFIARHNLAVFYHVNAIDIELSYFNNNYSEDDLKRAHLYWAESINRWKDLAENKSFWIQVDNKIKILNEPGLTNFIKEIQKYFLESLIRINALFAVEYAKENKPDFVNAHISYMSLCCPDNDMTLNLLYEITSGAKDDIKRSIENIYKGLNTNEIIDVLSKNFLDQIKKPFLVIEYLFSNKDYYKIDLFDEIADCLRSCSVKAYNSNDNLEFALELNNKAIEFCRGEETLKKLNKDRSDLLNIQEHKNFKYLVKIKNDELEVTNDQVRYNNTTLMIATLTGIKFGIYAHYTNGIKDTCSYLIDLADDRYKISIECKRSWVSEEKAKECFNNILDVLDKRGIISGISTRLSNAVLNGKLEEIGSGNCIITIFGILFISRSKGALVLWKDIRFSLSNGELKVNSADNNFNQSYNLRDTWNAVLFECYAKHIANSKEKVAVIDEIILRILDNANFKLDKNSSAGTWKAFISLLEHCLTLTTDQGIKSKLKDNLIKYQEKFIIQSKIQKRDTIIIIISAVVVLCLIFFSYNSPENPKKISSSTSRLKNSSAERYKNSINSKREEFERFIEKDKATLHALEIFLQKEEIDLKSEKTNIDYSTYSLSNDEINTMIDHYNSNLAIYKHHISEYKRFVSNTNQNIERYNQGRYDWIEFKSTDPFIQFGGFSASDTSTQSVPDIKSFDELVNDLSNKNKLKNNTGRSIEVKSQIEKQSQEESNPNIIYNENITAYEMVDILQKYQKNPDNSMFNPDTISKYCMKLAETGNELHKPLLINLSANQNASIVVRNGANAAHLVLNKLLTEQNMINIIKSGDYKKIKLLAKDMVKSKNYNPNVLNSIYNFLENFVESSKYITSNDDTIEAVSFCCILLSGSDNIKYKAIIENIANSETINKKIRKYAKKALKLYSR